MFDFDEALKRVPTQAVLCVGDVMLDDFVYGDVTRISPEAPTAVLAVRHSVVEIGGAGNVARNIATLGARCVFVGLIGDDDAGRVLMKALAQFNDSIIPDLVVEASRQTTRKVRFVSEHHSTHLMRADWETPAPASAQSQAAIIARAEAALPKVGAVVLSDYAKGVLTEDVVRAVIDAARRYAQSQGALGRRASARRHRCGGRGRRRRACRYRRLRCRSGQAQRGRHDALRYGRAAGPRAGLSGQGARRVGRGRYRGRRDGGAAGARNAVRASDARRQRRRCGGGRQARHGDGVARGSILPAASTAGEDKIVFDWSLLDERLAQWRRAGLRIGFTNGCFDLLHRGHVRLLAEARAACDRLIVGLNSDASTRRLKGPTRPINPAESRAEVLAALEAVDLVVVFEEDTPLALIGRVRPAVLIKGADYQREEVVGRELVEADGGDVILVDLVPGHSTTAMVERARPKEPAAE
jgi:D-beta-D-heptose 7-phosphate kinase/D-beta-D-heptose 1-phosphate adenosyltransferase